MYTGEFVAGHQDVINILLGSSNGTTKSAALCLKTICNQNYVCFS